MKENHFLTFSLSQNIEEDDIQMSTKSYCESCNKKTSKLRMDLLTKEKLCKQCFKSRKEGRLTI